MKNPIGQFYEEFWSDRQPDTDHVHPCARQQIKLLQKYAPAGQGRRALDVGCGSGHLTAVLGNLGYKAIGVDISSMAIEVAKAKHPECEFRVSPLDGPIPLDDESCDLVLCSEVIEHVFDVPGLLSDINRVTRPNGTFFVTTPYHGLLKNLVIAVANFAKHFDPFGGHIRFFDKASLGRGLREAGFNPEVWKGVGRIAPLHMSIFVRARKVAQVQPTPPSV